MILGEGEREVHERRAKDMILEEGERKVHEGGKDMILGGRGECMRGEREKESDMHERRVENI